MQKNLRSLLLFIVLAVLGGMVYGLLHHTLSYAISPEYFRLHLFGLFENLGPPRSDFLSVILLSLGSTWWVGLIVGGVLAGIAWQFGNRNRFLHEVSRAYILTLLVAFGVGLLGLAIGWITAADLAEVYDRGLIPEGTPVQNPQTFVAVDTMHGTSYVGALVGLIVGIVRILGRSRQ